MSRPLFICSDPPNGTKQLPSPQKVKDASNSEAETRLKHLNPWQKLLNLSIRTHWFAKQLNIFDHIFDDYHSPCVYKSSTQQQVIHFIQPDSKACTARNQRSKRKSSLSAKAWRWKWNWRVKWDFLASVYLTLLLFQTHLKRFLKRVANARVSPEFLKKWESERVWKFLAE